MSFNSQFFYTEAVVAAVNPQPHVPDKATVVAQALSARMDAPEAERMMRILLNGLRTPQEVVLGLDAQGVRLPLIERHALTTLFEGVLDDWPDDQAELRRIRYLVARVNSRVARRVLSMRMAVCCFEGAVEYRLLDVLDIAFDNDVASREKAMHQILHSEVREARGWIDHNKAMHFLMRGTTEVSRAFVEMAIEFTSIA